MVYNAVLSVSVSAHTHTHTLIHGTDFVTLTADVGGKDDCVNIAISSNPPQP